MNKGSELDKQIYPEGEPTWGCKYGVLDVEDVKEFIKQIDNYTEKIWIKDEKYKEDYEKGHSQGWNDAIEEVWDFITKISGEKLMKTKEFNLSEKILKCSCGLHNCGETYMPTKEVKEFIKRLKEELFKNFDGRKIFTLGSVLEEINKLAGKDLVEEKK